MTPAERLRELIELDPRPPSDTAKAAGMKTASQLDMYRAARRKDPSLSVTGRILAALGRKWADLDEPA